MKFEDADVFAGDKSGVGDGEARAAARVLMPPFSE